MESHTKKALSATRALHKRLRELEITDHSESAKSKDNIDWKALRQLAADANRAVQAMQRHASHEALCADVRANILREAVRDELIDREANAARVQERQRSIFEGQEPDALSALDKASQLVAVVESSIASLCPHRLQRAPGVSVLAETV